MLNRSVLCLLFSVLCGSASAQNQTINGNLTVTGMIGSAGTIETDSNTLTFGTQGADFGAQLLYQDNNTDTFTFLSNRNPASWLWQHTVGIAAMRLDANHQLILYKSDGATAGVTLTPASNQLSLGTATLTASGTALTTNGALTVAGNLTNSSASATTSFMGNVGIGTASPGAKLDVFGGDVKTRFGAWPADNTGIQIGAEATERPRIGFHVSDNSRRFKVEVNNINTANERLGFFSTAGGAIAETEFLTLNKGGNVGIGTTSPGAKLEVIGDISLPSSGGNKQIFTWAPTDANWRIGMSSIPGFSRALATAHVEYLTYSNGAGQGFAVGVNGGDSSFEVRGSDHTAYFRGNVGIGTATPNRKLSAVITSTDGVSGPVASAYPIAEFINSSSGGGQRGLEIGAPTGSLTAPVYLKVSGTSSRFAILNENSSENLSVLSSGNVGIGTTNPISNLEIKGASGQSASLTVGGGIDSITALGQEFASLQFRSADGSINNTNQIAGRIVSVAEYSNGAYAGLAFETFTQGAGIPLSEKMRITYNGNVGIGTTTPAYKIHATDSSNQVSLGIGEPMSSTTVLTGFRAASWNDGNVYLDAKVGTGGSLIYRYGEGAQSGSSNAWMIVKGGNVGIGTTNPTHKLAVAGTIRAQEIIVDNTNWADYVFEEDYRLAPLAEVESHIKATKHLPGIPSATEVAEHGVSMGEMQAKLLSKVEELTLHLIRMDKENAAQSSRLAALEQENDKLRRQLSMANLSQ